MAQPFFQLKVSPNPLVNKLAKRGIALFFIGATVLFLRHLIASGMVSFATEAVRISVYWTYIYSVDMFCLGVLMWGIGYLVKAVNPSFWKLPFLIDAIASFCWYDVFDRLINKCYSISKDDFLAIAITVTIFIFKQYKTVKGKLHERTE